MDSIQRESHSITDGVHCGFVCFLPVLMHKVNATAPMCTDVRAYVCVFVCVLEAVALVVGLDHCTSLCADVFFYVHEFMCTFNGSSSQQQHLH